MGRGAGPESTSPGRFFGGEPERLAPKTPGSPFLLTSGASFALATGFADPAAPGAEKNATFKEEQRKAKIAVWYYLCEWGEIAKSDITRRDYLIQLGLAKRKKPSKGPQGRRR